MWLVRHWIAVGIVVTACAIMGYVFAFARPVYQPEWRTRDYDMTNRQHYTVQQVRRVFAAHGFALRNGNVVAGDRGAWMRPLLDRSGLEVDVFGPRAKVGWGRNGKEPLSRLVGNVGASYGGPDDRVVERALDALSDLG